MIKRLALLAASLLVLSSLLFVGCESASNPIAPSNSTLTLSASPTVLTLTGESSTITAIGFRPDGNPLNPGTQILFSTTNGALRASNSSSAPIVTVVEVGTGGRAQAWLFGDGRQGVAEVTAQLAAGAGDGGPTMTTVSVQIGNDATNTPTVTVTANPTAISLNESSTITITARQIDGSPLVGEQVQVRTTLGSLSPPGPLTTDSNGIATTVLRSSQSGQASVIASVGTSGDSDPAVVEIGTTRKPTLTLSANPSAVDPGEISTITMTIRDENGNLISGSRQVFLDANLGTLSTSTSGPFSTSLTVTVTGGRGTVFFLGGSLAGDDGGVSGFVDNSDTVEERIEIRTVPAAITIGADENEIQRSSATPVVFTAGVSDETNRPVSNEIVNFTVQGLDANRNPINASVPAQCSESPCSAATGTQGTASVTITFGPGGQEIPGEVSFVRVTADARDATASVVLDVAGGGS